MNDISSVRRPSVMRRLTAISLGWVVVAALEATAYTVLAFAIAQHQPPGLVLVSAVLAMLATIGVQRAGFFSGARLAGDLYRKLGDALARAKLSWFNDEHRALVAMLAGRGIPGFMSVPAHQMQAFLHAPLIPLFLLVGVGLLAGPDMVLLAGGLLALSLAAQFLAQLTLSRVDARRHAAELASVQATLELVDHLELLRTAAGPVRAIERQQHRWRQQESALARTTHAAAAATFVSTLATAIPLAGMALYLALSSRADPAMMLALLVLIARAAAPLDELALAGLGANELRAAIGEYRKATHAPALPEPVIGESAQPDGYAFVLRDVSYPPALKNIDAEIPEGARVLIQGRSGSGKSTLLGLLMRFDDPQQGRMTLGGVSLDQLRYDELAARIAYVAQDPIVFTGTLSENIRLGWPDATDQDVEQAARMAALGDVLDRTPLGLQQSVGHQGNALSGGERQRVALARALLKQAPILILDEATAALDEATECEIATTVCALPGTVILITHRDAAIWQPTHIISLHGTST